MTMLPEYKPQFGETLRQGFENARDVASSREDGRCLLVFNGGHYMVKATDSFTKWVSSPAICEGQDDFHAQIVDRLADPQVFMAEVFRAVCKEEAAGMLRDVFDGVRVNGH